AAGGRQQGRGQRVAGEGRAAGGLSFRRVDQQGTTEAAEFPRSGRHRRRTDDGGRDRRRYAAASGDGTRGSRLLHPRLGRAAQAVVHEGLPAGNHRGLQYLRAGRGAIDQMSSTDQTKPFVPLNIAVLTISDTRSLADDKSGATLAERLTGAGHRLAAREIVT